jgi:hypothetical protein
MRKSFKITLVILATLSLTSCKDDESANFKRCMNDRDDREFCGGIYHHSAYVGTNRIVSGSGGGAPPKTVTSNFTTAHVQVDSAQVQRHTVAQEVEHDKVG